MRCAGEKEHFRMDRKAIGVIVAGIALFYVITDPSGAADAVQAILGGLKDGAVAVITFFKGIFR